MRPIQVLLFEVPSQDPWAFVIGAAGFAAGTPRRMASATQIDSSTALRMEYNVRARLQEATADLSTLLINDLVRSVEELEQHGVNTRSGLVAVLNDVQAVPSVAAAACHVASRLKDATLAPAVAEVFARASAASTIWEAAKALVALKDDTTAISLSLALQNSIHGVRQAAAAWALGALGRRDAGPGLLQLVENDEASDSARAHAAEALGRLGVKEASDALVGALSHQSAEIRYWSAYALGCLATATARTKLQHLAETDGGVTRNGLRVSDEAKWALKQIDGVI